MTHASRIDVAVATRSLFSALDARPFDVVVLRDEANRSVALELSDGGNSTTVAGSIKEAPESRYWLELHPALEDFLIQVAKERQRLDEARCGTENGCRPKVVECPGKGRKRVHLSIHSCDLSGDIFFPCSQNHASAMIDIATFSAEKADVSGIPDGKRLLLSLTFIHCDDPSLNEVFLRLCQYGLNGDSASIDRKTCGNSDHGFGDRRTLDFLKHYFDGHVVFEGGFLAVDLSPSFGGIGDGEDIVFFRVRRITMQSKSVGNSDVPGVGSNEHHFETTSSCEAVKKGALFRLGSADEYTVVAFDCIAPSDTHETSTTDRSLELHVPSSSISDDVASNGCPGYEQLLQDLVDIANIEDRTAAPTAILLTGSAGVGKSQLARHVVKILAMASQAISVVAKVVSAKDILLAAVSSSLEGLKAFILREPEKGNNGDTSVFHANSNGRLQTTRSVLIIDDLDIFVDADSSGEESKILQDGEKLASVHAICGAIDDLVCFGAFGSGRKTRSDIHAPFIMGICGASSDLLPPELIRVGRMEKVIAMPPPTQSQREQILSVLFEGLCTSFAEHHGCNEQNTSSSEDIARQWASACAPVTSGCVAADLQRICVDAVTRASSNIIDTSPEYEEESKFAASDNGTGVVPKAKKAIVRWDDIREATISCIPSQLAQLEVSVLNDHMQQNVAPGHQVEPRMLHELSWKRFGGYDFVKAQLYRTVVGPWRRHMSSKSPATPKDMSLQIAPPSGVLFHGGPGVGKTFAAHCLASSLGFPVVKVRASDVLDQWLGGSEAAIRSLFGRARAASPCVLFFDEIDALANNREDDGGSTDVHSRVLSTLLNEIDGVSSDAGKKDVLVIAATNRLRDIDAALLRPGRLEEHILLRNPSAEDIFAMLKIHLCNVPLGENVSIKALSETLAKAGASGADVEGICNEACMNAVHQLSSSGNPQDVVVSAGDFKKVVQQWKL